jgi:hypothetical protein
MYKKAIRLKLRYNTISGNLTTEDLWDLPLRSTRGASLDNLAKMLNKEIQSNEEESFVDTPSAANGELRLKFEIVKDIIKDRLSENEAKRNAATVKKEKEVLMGIINKKQNESLESESLDDLKKRLEELG